MFLGFFLFNYGATYYPASQQHLQETSFCLSLFGHISYICKINENCMSFPFCFLFVHGSAPAMWGRHLATMQFRNFFGFVRFRLCLFGPGCPCDILPRPFGVVLRVDVFLSSEAGVADVAGSLVALWSGPLPGPSGPADPCSGRVLGAGIGAVFFFVKAIGLKKFGCQPSRIKSLVTKLFYLFFLPYATCK